MHLAKHRLSARIQFRARRRIRRILHSALVMKFALLAVLACPGLAWSPFAVAAPLPADPLLAALVVDDAAYDAALDCLGQAVYYAVAADLGGPYAGVVSGMVSMCGQIAGAITASLTPFLATRYGWEYAFYVAAGVTFICIIPWLFVNPSRGIYFPRA